MDVNEIFNDAKEKFQYVSDQTQYSKIEYWATIEELQKQIESTGVFKGDCEDFAEYCVSKMRANNLRGRYVFCRTETNEYHLVAECEGKILDNRQARVVEIDDLDYRWISISGYESGDPWREIK